MSDFSSPKIYSVSELTQEIQKLLEGRFDSVWIEGEISNFTAPLSSHYYMVLKDDKATIRAVMFRPQARTLRFVPENGMTVIAQGRVGIYAPRGEYQMVLDYLEPLGVGALAAAFEQLKKKLAAQGLFDVGIKRPLPFLPQRVAVITSPTGAAIQDFLKIMGRRFANMEIIVVPVRVQGEDAAGDMVRALDLVNRELNVDVIILTRGGGSLEDLWAFNQEDLALAIRRSKIPVVSAVGHEIDFTICDFVADVRAPTPSAAAEMLVVEKEILIHRIRELRERLLTYIRAVLKGQTQTLAHLRARLKDPRRGLSEAWLRLDDFHSRLTRAISALFTACAIRLRGEHRSLVLNSPLKTVEAGKMNAEFLRGSLIRAMTAYITDKDSRLALLGGRLGDLSPLSVLTRGYSITRTYPDGDLVRDSAVVGSGDRIQVLLGKGQLICRIEGKDRQGST